MNALGIDIGNGPVETCAGCFKPFRRAERMNAMEYDNGDSAGWHCDDCVQLWKSQGEDALPRWKADS